MDWRLIKINNKYKIIKYKMICIIIKGVLQKNSKKIKIMKFFLLKIMKKKNKL